MQYLLSLCKLTSLVGLIHSLKAPHLDNASVVEYSTNDICKYVSHNLLTLNVMSDRKRAYIRAER